MVYEASDFLRADHRQVEDHLDVLLDALKHLSLERIGDVRGSFKEIHRLLLPHLTEEEQVFYPAVQPFAEHLLADMLRQHEDIRETSRCLEELLAGFPEAPGSRDMEELYRLGVEAHDAVQVHIVDEEEGLLKLVDQHLSIQQQHELFAAMQGGAMTQTKSDSGGPMREPGAAAGSILNFDLTSEIQRLHSEEPWQSTGRNAKTMIKHPDFRIVLTVLKAGKRVEEHHTVGRISVQTVEGHIRMRVGKEAFDLPQGRLIALDTAIPHDVEALENSAFLLTIAFPAPR